MEENTNLTAEQTADQQEAFLDGWEDEPTEAEEAADQQTERAEEPDVTEGESTEAEDGEQAEGAQAETESETTDSGSEEGGEQPKQQTAAPTWTVKHMDETRTLGVGDVTPELLQKGLDYDRIRGKYDEAKPVMEMFSQFAAQAGMSVSDYARSIRREAKKAGGMSEAEAWRAVELEDREANLFAREAERQAQAQARQAGEARVREDLAQFAKAFPEVYEQAKSDPKRIPEGVWQDIDRGLSLTAAYSRYAVAKASQWAASAAQNRKNALRSTGSLRSAGNDAGSADPFLEGFGY